MIRMSKKRKQKGNFELTIDWLRVVFPYSYEIKSDRRRFKTKGKNKIVSVIPWVDKIETELNTVFDIFGLPLFDKNVKTTQWYPSVPLWNYDSAIQHGSIRVMYNFADMNKLYPKNRMDMGIAIEMSGSAIREYEQYMFKNGLTWSKLFKRLSEERPDAKVTRIDVALDVINGIKSIQPRSLLRLAKNNQISTKIKTYKFYESGDTRTGDVQGETFYLGKSDFKLRVYDKKSERMYSHGDSFLNDVETWVRWEIQLANKYSKMFFDNLAMGMDMTLLYFSLLDKLMKVVEKNDEMDMKQRSKLPALKWWVNFIDDTTELHVLNPKPNQTLVRNNNYLERQVSKTLVKTLIAHQQSGGDPKQLISHWIEQGIRKLSYDDVITIQNLIQDSVELKRDGKEHSYVPENLKLELDDEEYEEFKENLNNFKKTALQYEVF